MAKATLTQAPTPTQQLVHAATQEFKLTDSQGRVISLKKPGVLAQFRLVEALGDAAKNQVYMGMVFPLLYVAAIDGEYLNPLTSKKQVELLIQRLDDAGIAAVMEGVPEHFGKSDPEADKEALKNE